MAEFETLSRGWDHLGNIERTLGDLQGARTTIHELIQNADDAPGATCMRFRVTPDRLEVWNDGIFERCSDVSSAECGWLVDRKHRCDFHSFRKTASGDKRNRPGTTGAFGVGFTAVYQFTDRPELLSNGEHWIVEETAPESERIKRHPTGSDADGTTFRLPWAFEQSAFRAAVRQEPITRAFVETFANQLLAAVPDAMPFLKKLRSIEVVDPQRSRTFTRTVSQGRITIADDAGGRREWALLHGEFEGEAQALRAAHSGVIGIARDSQVSLAVPIGGDMQGGLLFATLPTEEPAHLPLLINADFIPASDRKRIRFDDSPASAWNREAIRAAARLLACNMVELVNAIGDASFVALLAAARDLARRRENDRTEPVFAEFWEQIEQTLPKAPVVPVEGGTRATPEVVRLWSDESELAAAEVLDALGVRLVERGVRADWYGLRGAVAGLRVLSLGDVVVALRQRGATRSWRTGSSTNALTDDAGLDQLWALIEFLLSVNDRWNQESRQSLLGCAIVPCWDGAIWPISRAVRGDQQTQDLFADLDVDAVFLDQTRLQRFGGRLAALVAETSAGQVIAWAEHALARAELDVREADRHRLLSWFFERRATLDDAELKRVAQLPIFPTAAGSRPLVGLALPGDFTDELGLAQLVDVDSAPDMAPWFVKLGAKTLKFSTYCIDFVPQALESDSIAEDTRLRLVGLLARKLSEVQDNEKARDALRPVPLVPCRGRRWFSGDDVYLDPGVASVVGDGINIAVVPSINPTAHRTLFAWLGAAAEPRPRDIEARCQQLRGGAANHRSIAEAIVSHVGRRFTMDRDAAAVQFARLREIPWLPAEGDSGARGHLPSRLHSAFSKALFASQATFVDISLGVQRENSDFLKWLGVVDQPTPQQVVDHLLWSAQQNQPVGEGTWIYLNQRADDEALSSLIGRACLLIADSGMYLRPSEVYWGGHPFGRFRYQLGARFADYRALLDRLQVRQLPSPADAIDVLLDVAAHHGGERAPLLTDDALVVNACWRLLSSGIESGELDPSQLGELTTAEVVPDGRGWPSTPTEVFFRDLQTLADRFGPEVQSHFIDRPDGQWQALAAAGVRDLSAAVETRVLEEVDGPAGGVVAERLTSRRRLVMRVMAADDVEAVKRLNQFEARIALVRLTRLTIEQALDVSGVVHRTQPFHRGALFRPDVEALFYVESELAPSWVEIARELTRALGVGGFRAPDVASALRGVLSAESFEEARRDLDELGFRALDETSEAQAAPTVASDFGGAEPTGDDSDEARESEPGEQDHGDEGAEAVEQAGFSVSRDLSHGTTPGGASRYEPTEPADVGATDRALTTPDETSTSANGAEPSTANTPSERSSARDSAGDRVATSASTQTRLRSYVTPKAPSGLAPHDSGDEDAVVERAGVEAVMAYERAHGREPEEMPPLNPGFDVRSVDRDERERFIEIKSTAGQWGERGVAMSSMQFDTALKRREDFWLYVVDRALTAPVVHPIQDPASKVDQYFFDDGWQSVVEHEQVDRPRFEPIQLLDRADAPPDAVPFYDVDNGRTSEPLAADGWLVWEDRQCVPGGFAVRIAGYGLGIPYYGGAALVEPIDGEPEDDELVCVVLAEQTDPDSQSKRSVRRWAPERDLTGARLGLRLTTDGSVEPLTVRVPERLIVLGKVIDWARPTDPQLKGGMR
jgi:hypothetical protein